MKLKKGKHCSEEHKRKISIANRGRKHTEETKRKIGNRTRGKTYEEIYGVIGAKIMRKKHSKTMKGKTSMHKGKTFEEIHGVEGAQKLRKEISDSLKGRVSQLKGKTYEEINGVNYAKIRKETQSKARKGKTYEEIYGVIGAKIKKKKQSDSLKGRLSPRKNKTFEELYGTEAAALTKGRMRLSAIQYIKENCGGISPRIGKYEKQILNKVQNIIGFSIKRQFYINGYFLDGYCQELNLAIEIDECHHYDNDILREKDIIKQNSITKSLNCDFLRIRVAYVVENNNINIKKINKILLAIQ